MLLFRAKIYRGIIKIRNGGKEVCAHNKAGFTPKNDMTERYEEYHFYKDLKICVRCHKNQAEPHKVMCLECADKEREQNRNSRNRNLEKEKKRDLEKYYKLKEMGICTYCKREKAVAGKQNALNALQRYGIRRTQRKPILTVQSV